MSNLSDKELRSFMIGEESKIFNKIIRICSKDCLRILMESSLKPTESECLQNCFNKHYLFSEHLGAKITQLMQGKETSD